VNGTTLLLLLPLAMCAWLSAWPMRAGAQAAADAVQRRDAAFESMMAAPADPERAFEFARAAAATGDLRGAIAALERILRINPGLSNIELELGVLYLRAGSPDLAALYLRRALAAHDMPPAVRDRAQSLLARAERAQRRHLFTGSLYAGMRYDENANAGPDSRLVRVLGVDGLLDEAATGQNDVSAELAGAINYTYALDSQAGHEIEANLGAYNRFYRQVTEFDFNSLTFDIGPRLYVGAVPEPSLSVRPYLLGSYVLLDYDDYLGYAGAGVNVRKFLGPLSYVEATLEASDQNYHDSATRPTNSLRSGTYIDLRGGANLQLTPTTRLFGGLGYARRDSRVDFESFDEGGLRLGVTQLHPAPFGLTALSWSTSLSATVRRTAYDAADPAIDPNEKRTDTRADLSLSTNARLSPALTAIATLQYTDNDSTLPNFDYDNWGVAMGLAWSF
jgi:hypothetical protein